ncbi:LysR family transcriptional regulator [Glutamicibacter sp. NPDC087344]|uniref:LysR family transcriptional regulator n=1 Tax=Glutamicibacter sp. NPDC087344 TaxID=3363994 RepID=UPI003825F844
MILRQLEYFVALAREQHFARAAEECSISQPALSESIRKLEAGLQVPLVRRGHAFQGLTPEGEVVLRWAQRLLADRDAMSQEVAALQSELSATLRLGVVPAASSTVALLSDAFARANPKAKIHIQGSLRSTEILAHIRSFELDAGLIYAEPDELGGLLAVPLYREEHILITAQGMLESAGAPMPVREVIDLPLCLLDSSMRGRQMLDEVLVTHGRNASPRIECDSIVTLLAQVSTGRWASVVPVQWLEPLGELPGLVRTPLTNPQITSQISLVMNEHQPLPLILRALLSATADIYPSVTKHLDKG